MGIIFENDQKMVIKNAIKAMNSFSTQVYEYSGGAGTGKSLVMMAILEELNVHINRTAPMAYIGQAAIVMRTKGLINARTSHSWLLEPNRVIRKNADGSIVMDKYYNVPEYDFQFTPKVLENIKYILVDEGGSMPMSMKPYIENHGIKVIVSGDIDQLPPVGDNPAYLTDPNIDRLTKIMRQGRDSAIPYIAERAKLGLPIHKGFYGDVLVIEWEELTDEMVMYSDVVICGKNETKDLINKRIREELLGIRSDIPVVGEKLMCRKNNWYLPDVDGIHLANGLSGIVTGSPGVYGYDGDTYTINFRPNLLNRSFMNIRCDYAFLISDFKQKKDIKSDRYSQGEKFEFGYASTCHMTQGSEYSRVVYIEEYLNPLIQKNLNYVGCTRARDFLIYVLPKRKTFF